MTRRRRLRTRTLVLIVAAAVAGAIVIPALGAPDPVQQQLRAWDGVLSDGRAGEPLPLQVIVVLAAPPAVSIESSEAVKIATATQQLDLDAITRMGIELDIKYRYVNALNAVSATVRADQMGQLRAAPEVAGIYPVRNLYPAATVAAHLKSLGAGARPLAGKRAGRGVTVALLDGPLDGTHPYLHDPAAGWNAINGKPADPTPIHAASAHATAMAGIVIGKDGPEGLHGVAPQARLLPIQVMEMQHGDLIGTTATLLAGIDRALDPNGDGDLSDHADVILAPVAEPFAAFGASAETVAAEGAERAGAVLVAAAGNDGPTGGRWGTVASPAASPGWLAVGASDGRVRLPKVGVTFTTDKVDSELGDAPLAGALAPVSGIQMPLVLPFGPTESDPLRDPADIAEGTDEGDFPVDGTSIVKGKAVLLPRDGALISERAEAASAAGAKALVLYGDGGVPAGALGLDDRVRLPIVVISGEPGRGRGGHAPDGRCGDGHVRHRRRRRQSGRAPRRALLVHGPRVRRLGQARPARSGRRRHDLGAGRALPRAERHVGLGGAGRRGGRARAAGASHLEPAARARGARRHRDSRVGGGAGDGPAPVEAQGGGSVNVAGGQHGQGRRHARDAHVRARAALAGRHQARAHAHEHEQGTVHVPSRSCATAVPTTAPACRSTARRRISRSAPARRVPVPLELKAHDLPAETTVVGGWLHRHGRRRRHDPRALGARSQRRPRRRPDRRARRSRRRASSRPRAAARRRRLTLVLGSASSNGTARLEIAPVQRLSVDLYRNSQLLGRHRRPPRAAPRQLPLRHHGHRSEHGQAARAGRLPARRRRGLERRGDERAAARLHRRRLSAGMVEVVLYEGAGCGLCARARELLEGEAPRLGFRLRRVSIDGDDELERRYRIDLPVILIDGDLAFTQAVAPGPLQRAVERAQARRREASS